MAKGENAHSVADRTEHFGENAVRFIMMTIGSFY